MPRYQERAAGVYRCRYIGTEEREFTDKETGELTPRWVWKFQEIADSTTVGQMDQITGTSLRSPNSNAYKIASGILGRKLAPGDDTDDHVGALVDVVYGPNQAGNLAITSVMRVQTPQNGPGAAQAAPVVSVPTTPDVAPLVASTDVPDELPF